MLARLFFLVLLATPAIAVDAQATSRPRMLLAFGIAGQRDGDRDLGSAGIAAELGVTWRVRSSVRARLSAHVFTLPGGQGCSCDPGDPPLSVQGTYGAVFALQSLPEARPLYWLAGVSLRRGGFRAWNEQQTAGLLAGLGWTLGASRRLALEARYEHFTSPLGATRALLPITVVWRP
ncbi:MAG: hypothetical protein IT359_10815 [Gemmatimonadaceae bacterium]|nr:hypothetical protein [Gemmatimonadaceae bacterium]